MRSLYIHIPFCNRICTYCDFNKFLIKNQPVDEYIDCLIKELSLIEEKELLTVFIGGGTPTALNEAQLERLLDFIQQSFTIHDEFTVEANPDELTRDKIALMKQYGVNRLSLGVQTFDNELLKSLGRTHQEQDIFNAVNDANALGIESISIDLMYHLPTQTIEQCRRDLELATALDIQHISSYSLILEPKTQFYNMYKKGMLQLPDEQLAAEMYTLTMDTLSNHGFHQYEISNYAKGQHESVHNKVYWQNKEYYGAGAGSHGYIDGVRYYNVAPVPHYIKAMHNGDAVKERIPVTLEAAMEEFMFLGLRMNDGISKHEFLSRYGKSYHEVFGDITTLLVNEGYLIETEEYVSLSPLGRMRGNDVFEKFLLTV
ncbi:radical SAM family heme chaperone HemW [Macrococcoides canis]|uniref:radical SAM family heme chaperone HemW n=1 Tax=Macrococcoides canis TaxID=1855823 RepID=UPI0020B8B1A2|nr:radical SAM family heme chaperone HemW [Macrococcus canis]UTH10686.1 oxygen-independent coproporphyrinogen III oxidase [Macrococcus canis]